MPATSPSVKRTIGHQWSRRGLVERMKIEMVVSNQEKLEEGEEEEGHVNCKVKNNFADNSLKHNG